MMKIVNLKNVMQVILLSMLVIFLTSCGGSSGGTTSTPDGTLVQKKVRFNAPTDIQNASSIVDSQLFATVTINGQDFGRFERSSSGQYWLKSEVQVKTGTNDYIVKWFEHFDGGDIQLGEVQGSTIISASATEVVLSQQNFDSNRFDEDKDNYSNLAEREQNTDPISPSEYPGAVTVTTKLQVKINVPVRQYSSTPELSFSWGGREINLVSESNGQVYTGVQNNVIPDTAKMLVNLKLKGITIASVQGLLSVTQGDNFKEIKASDFIFVNSSVKLVINATIPSRNYSEDVNLYAKIDSDGFEKLDSSGARNYSKEYYFDQSFEGSHTVKLELRRQSDSLIYARSTKNFNASLGFTNQIYINENDFDFNIDSDGDGITNIDDSEPNQVSFVVNIPRISQSVFIDGYIDSAWSNAVTHDSRGVELTIDKLMIDNTGVAKNNVPDTTWRAMHDGYYLYLLVETVDSYVYGDSGVKVWDDDDLNIYWDGNYSQGNSYDGYDDFHILIPFRNANDDYNIKADGQSRYYQGSNSARLPIQDIDWAARECHYDRGRQTCVYEVSIYLNSAKIPLGKKFGIDLHVDDDDNGGIRDTKWGWHHPVRQNHDIDYTDNAPKYMGAAILR